MSLSPDPGPLNPAQHGALHSYHIFNQMSTGNIAGLFFPEGRVNWFLTADSRQPDTDNRKPETKEGGKP